jgi:tRNA threonylcarbamoyladenosine biosynthesis protein TsaE
MITQTAEETIRLGEDIARYLKPKDVIALVGELGCGKTTLTKGIAQGLGVKNSNYVNSPSFILIREYKGKINLYHIDLYRLETIEDAEALAIEEYLYCDGVSVVEWAQKLKGLMPKEYLRIEIKILDNNSRGIKFKAFGKRYENISSRCIDKSNKRCFAG